MELTSIEVVRKIISGDEQSFEKLYRYFYPRLIYFAKQYIYDIEVSRNIVQDVFTELWDKRNALHEETNLNAWLFKVTKNKSLKIISRLKSQKNYDSYLKSRQLDVNYNALSDFDTSKELQAQINAALEKLSPACRKVFELSRFEDRKNKEIAEELNLSIKTVEAHISKALRSLKADLKDYLPLFYILFSPS